MSREVPPVEISGSGKPVMTGKRLYLKRDEETGWVDPNYSDFRLRMTHFRLKSAS
jgi:hypothetical protein